MKIRKLCHLKVKRIVIAGVGGEIIRFVVDTGADETILSMDDIM